MATITRADWGAPPNTAPRISTPVLEFWLHHGVVPFWVGVQAARNLDRIARDRGFLGISYSWLTDRAGNEIEGRGWGRLGAHTRGRNSISHAICLVGNLDAHPMPAGMIRGAVRLVRRHRRFGPGRITGPHSAAPGASTACPGRFGRAQIPGINRQAAGSAPAPTPKDWFDMASKADLQAVVRAENERQTKAIAWEVLKGLIWQSNEAPVKVDSIEAAAQRQMGMTMHATLRDAIVKGGHSREALEELVESVVRRVLDERA